MGLVWLGALALARWLPRCCGLDGEEEGEEARWHSWGSPQEEGPVVTFLFHLKRHGENLGKRQLEENENDEGMGTGSAGKALNVARHGQTCFCKLCFGVGSGCGGGSHSCGQTLGIASMLLEFLLQLECLM